MGSPAWWQHTAVQVRLQERGNAFELAQGNHQRDFVKARSRSLHVLLSRARVLGVSHGQPCMVAVHGSAGEVIAGLAVHTNYVRHQ